MKLTPAELAEIRANGFGRDDVVRLCEHIAAVEREHEQALSHWVDKCSRLGAERDRMRGALVRISGVMAGVFMDNDPSIGGAKVEFPCGSCEAMKEAARKALGK